MTMATMTRERVAEIAFEVEARNADNEEYSTAYEDRPVVARPAGVRADNDGMSMYWVRLGVTYTLTHDGVGWRVARDDHAPSWQGHVYRLADASGPKGAFVSALPLAGGGRLELDPATVYELKLGAPDTFSMCLYVIG